MVIVTANVYDNGADGGDGNLTQVTQYVDSTTTRVTAMGFDFRDRKIATDGEVDFYEEVYYDNLNRVVETQRYDTTASGNPDPAADLLPRTSTRAAKSTNQSGYGVDPTYRRCRELR